MTTGLTVLVTVAAVAAAMALVLSIAISRMDAAEARRREVFRGRSCWAQDPGVDETPGRR
ncbi:MAG: hypothetical protein WBB52_00070 [Acidimicrobiales bacterium]